MLVMIGKRGCLAPEVYREHYREADQLAAMISDAINETNKKGRPDYRAALLLAQQYLTTRRKRV